MGHHLRARTVNAILRLKERGSSNRRIARELNVDRGAVARHLQATQQRMNNAFDKKELCRSIKKIQNKPARIAAGPPSKCAGLRDILVSKLRDGRTAMQIYRELVDEKGFDGSYYSVRRFVRQLKHVFPSLDTPTHFTRRWRNASDVNWMLAVLEGTKSVEVLREELGEVPDIATLLMRVRGGVLKDRDKAITILARVKGIRNSTIACFLHLNRGTTSRYFDVYSSHGLVRLFSVQRSVLRKPEDPKYKEAVIATLHSPPSTFGINRTTWKQADLRRVLAQKDIPICERNIRLILRNAGYRWRKAKKVLTSNAPDYRQKLDRIKLILANIGPNDRFFSIDEFGPFHITKKPGRRLVAPGEVYTIPQWQKSKGRLIVTAALELCTNQVTHFYSQRKNTEEMLRLLDVLLEQYQEAEVIYLSWDAASWHLSRKFHKRVVELNNARAMSPRIELAPLPANAQFLNVIESVFSGMARAIIHNSDYQSDQDAMIAIDRYFGERNETYKANPKRAGDKIWGEELVNPIFAESNNCKDPKWR